MKFVIGLKITCITNGLLLVRFSQFLTGYHVSMMFLVPSTLLLWHPLAGKITIAKIILEQKCYFCHFICHVCVSNRDIYIETAKS